MNWRKNKKTNSEENSKSDVDKNQVSLAMSQMEYLMLQSQINPHFLYNTLDSIRSEALMNKQLVIAEMIERLSKFFRYCISSRGNFVRLSEELSNVNDYYCIQKFRFENSFVLTTEIEQPGLLDFYIPKMILQPIVENAIAHGMEKMIEPGTIQISVKSTKKKLYITITDDGVGMSKSQLNDLNSKLNATYNPAALTEAPKSGIALTNINARIQLCFGSDYGIRVRSVMGEGTQIEVIVPLVDDLGLGNYEKKMSGVDNSYV